jgi:hypothetical protein
MKTLRLLSLLGSAVLVAGTTLAACVSPSEITATAQGEVQGLVLGAQGQPLPAVEFSIRQGRESQPYMYTSTPSDVSGRFSVMVRRIALTAKTNPDTVTYFVIGTLRPVSSGQMIRDSIPVVVRFGPPDRSAPITSTQLQLHSE